MAGRDCTKSRISEGRLSAAHAPLKAPKIRPCWLALPLISHCLPGRDVSTRACDPGHAGYMGLTSDRLELASGSGSQRAKMSKNTRFLDLWAAVGCPRRSEWSSGEPKLMGGLSRAPTLRRAQNLAHFGPRRASGSALRCRRRCQNAQNSACWLALPPRSSWLMELPTWS